MVGIRSVADYSPFGVELEGRTQSGVGYRYGFNGMESDDEVKGTKNSYTTKFRQYDPRIGRWLTLDPLMSLFPESSPFVAYANNPIIYIDPYGLAPTNGDEPNTNVKGSREKPRHRWKDKEGNRHKWKQGDTYEATDGSIWEYKGDDAGDKFSERWVRTPILEIEEVVVSASRKETNTNETSSTDSHLYWWLQTTNSTLGTLASGVDATLGGMKPNEQWRFTKNTLTPAMKKIPVPGVSSTNKVFKNVVKPTLKVAKAGTKKIPGVGLVMTVGDMAINQEVKPSHILDLTVAGVGTIPVFGWIVAGVYVIADGVTYAATGKTIGEHLDEVDWENLNTLDSFNLDHPVYQVMPTYSPGGLKY